MAATGRVADRDGTAADDVEGELAAEEVVSICNRVLSLAGLAEKVSNLLEVQLVCSSTSVFVAALEGLMQQRLYGVIRRPESPAERAFNVVAVVNTLAEVLQFDLSHISGPAVVEGSLEDIVNLLELLYTLSRGAPLQGPPGPQPPVGLQNADDGAACMVPHRSHAGIPSDEPATRGQGEAGGGDVHHHSSVSFAPGVPGQADGGDGGSYGDEGQWEGAPEAYEAGPSAAAEAAARTAPASSSHRPPGRHRQRPAGHSGGGGDAAGGSKRGQHARRAAEARARLDALSPIREGSREGGDSYAASPADVGADASSGQASGAALGTLTRDDDNVGRDVDDDDDEDVEDDDVLADQASISAGLRGAQRQRPAMVMSRGMAGRLAHLYKLQEEDPKARAARGRVQQRAVQAEAERQAARRQLVQRLARAGQRRDAAARLSSIRAEQTAKEYAQRVEQLRLQHLANEWQAAQHSARLRRATEAELALKGAFLEALEREKERLLQERRSALEHSAAHLPNFRRALSHAEGQYLQLYDVLEGQVAGERRRRLLADHEALAARREGNKLAAQVVHDRMQELLQRVANEEEATLQRRGLARSAKGRAALTQRLQRMIGLH